MNVGSVKRIHQSDWRRKGIRFLRARDLVAFSKHEASDDLLFIDKNTYDKYSQISGKVKKGDLLVTGVGTIGIPMLVRDDNPIYFKDGNIIWFKNDNKLDGQFLFYSFKTDRIQSFIKQSSGSGTVGTYTIQTGKSTPINFPKTHNEEQKIGELLSKVDNTLTLQQRKLKQLKMLKKALLQKMFADKDHEQPKLRFTGFSGEWKQRRLGEVSTIVGGGTPSTKVSEYWNGDINWYSPVEINNQIYTNKSQRKITELGLKKSSARLLPVGTVLFTSRAGIGNTAILSKEACTNQGFQSIVPKKNKLDSYFVYSITPQLKRYGETHGAGSTFAEISGKEMSKMPIKLPSYEEQNRVSSMFLKIDTIITLQHEQITNLQSLKKFLLQAMFI